jgi:hypothetical protein
VRRRHAAVDRPAHARRGARAGRHRRGDRRGQRRVADALRALGGELLGQQARERHGHVPRIADPRAAVA